MSMTLFETTRRDPHELGSLPQILKVLGTDIAHAAAQATEQLKDRVGKRSSIGNPRLHALGDKLA